MTHLTARADACLQLAPMGTEAPVWISRDPTLLEKIADLRRSLCGNPKIAYPNGAMTQEKTL